MKPSPGALNALLEGRHPDPFSLFGAHAGPGGTFARVWIPGAEVHGPEDTEWGQHEAALVDPDGNVIRFGSPMQ